MKAISLWQPWASAIAVGAKRYETRDWSTTYRGPLAIHASKRLVKRELRDLAPHWQAALWPLVHGAFDMPWLRLPFGAVVAVCDLADCIPTYKLSHGITPGLLAPRRRPQCPEYVWCEHHMGDFSAGRFAWKLENVRPLAVPLPFKGSQGFFDVEDSLLEFAASVGSGESRRG